LPLPNSPKNSVMVLVSIPPPSKSSKFLEPVVIFLKFILSSFTSFAVLNLMSSICLAALMIFWAVVRGMPIATSSSGVATASASMVP